MDVASSHTRRSCVVCGREFSLFQRARPRKNMLDSHSAALIAAHAYGRNRNTSGQIKQEARWPHARRSVSRADRVDGCRNQEAKQREDASARITKSLASCERLV